MRGLYAGVWLLIHVHITSCSVSTNNTHHIESIGDCHPPFPDDVVRELTPTKLYKGNFTGGQCYWFKIHVDTTSSVDTVVPYWRDQYERGDSTCDWRLDLTVNHIAPPIAAKSTLTVADEDSGLKALLHIILQFVQSSILCDIVRSVKHSSKHVDRGYYYLLLQTRGGINDTAICHFEIEMTTLPDMKWIPFAIALPLLLCLLFALWFWRLLRPLTTNHFIFVPPELRLSHIFVRFPELLYVYGRYWVQMLVFACTHTRREAEEGETDPLNGDTSDSEHSSVRSSSPLPAITNTNQPDIALEAVGWNTTTASSTSGNNDNTNRDNDGSVGGEDLGGQEETTTTTTSTTDSTDTERQEENEETEQKVKGPVAIEEGGGGGGSTSGNSSSSTSTDGEGETMDKGKAEMLNLVLQTQNNNSSSSSSDTSSSSEGPVCKYCREGEDAEPLIHPCNCTGTMSGLHASCLNQWRTVCLNEGRTEAALQCEVCNAPYEFGPAATGAMMKTFISYLLKQASYWGLLLLGNLFMIQALAMIVQYSIGTWECVGVDATPIYSWYNWRHWIIALIYWFFVMCHLYIVMAWEWMVWNSDRNMLRVPPEHYPYLQRLYVQKFTFNLVTLLTFEFGFGYVFKYLMYSNSHRFVWTIGPSMFCGVLVMFFVAFNVFTVWFIKLKLGTVWQELMGRNQEVLSRGNAGTGNNNNGGGVDV